MGKYDQNPEYDEVSAIAKTINLELVYKTRVASPVYTGKKITGEVAVNGVNEPINIMLLDRYTRQQVTNGRAASLKLKIVLIREDSCGVKWDEGIWTSQDFKNNIVVDFQKKKNILKGDLSLVLKDGCGKLADNIKIKHDRYPLRNVRFRLGAMVDDGDHHFPNYAIKEAVTYPFDVKDRRNESKNKGPLLLNDKVWQLVNISKKGPIRKRLEEKKVETVREFLSMYHSNPQVLKEICDIKGKKWEMTVNHAKTSLVDNVFRRVGSTSQKSDCITLFDTNDNINFFDDYDCYKSQLYGKEPVGNMFIVDCNFSVQDVEVGGVVFRGIEPYEEHDQQKGIKDVSAELSGVAKKRWMKLRATIWFSMVTLGSGRIKKLCVVVSV